MFNEGFVFPSVYGPVQSWRYGRSLGIDLVGRTSTCSFNCVYCQLGLIECQTWKRQTFVPTTQILDELQTIDLNQVDAITVSGSGEPTLALNLGEILTMVKAVTRIPVGVLTNGSLLCDPQVRQELAIADWVAVKIDAVSDKRFHQINRPLADLDMPELWSGLRLFRQSYKGHLAIQTMILMSWSEAEQAEYMELMQHLHPDEIQLNTPSRPRPLKHELDARGNHSRSDRPYPVRQPRHVSLQTLQDLGDRIQTRIGIPVRCPN